MGCTLIDQVWDDLCHAFVALGKGLGIVVIALFPVLKHILQMGDQLPISSGWNRWLMHVQSTGKCGLQLFKF